MNRFVATLVALSLSAVVFADDRPATNGSVEYALHARAGDCRITDHNRQLVTPARGTDQAAPPTLEIGPISQKAKHRLTPGDGRQTTEKPPLMIAFADLKWVDFPEGKGMQFAVISGDPQTGPYTQMRKVPAGFDNPLHTHSSEITNVIITGVWYTGADAASARDFGPGSIVRMPANWAHVSGCRPGTDCVFFQEGMGKFDYKPVDSKSADAMPAN